MSTPAIEKIWARIEDLAGERFHTKTGKPFTYIVSGDVLVTSRTDYNLTKIDFNKALSIVPIEGPGKINHLVRGPAYIWAILHDSRIRASNW